MKNILIVASLLLLCLSCNHETAEFNGLEPLIIGNAFTTVPGGSMFRKVMDDEYYADEYILPNGIGKISKVNVSTAKGKICEVRFTNCTSTNMNALRKIMSSLNEVKFGGASTRLMAKQHIAFKAYSNTKNNTNFMVLEHQQQTLKNGRPLYEFQYISNEAEKVNDSLTRKNMGLGKK